MRVLFEGREIETPGGIDEVDIRASTGMTVTPTWKNGNRLEVTLASSGGAGLVDGDYGDVTVSGSGTAMAIDAGAVTYAKMQSMTAGKLLGRNSGSGGAPEEITVGALLDLNGAGTLSCIASVMSVNGGGLAELDLDDVTPAAPAGGVNVTWQTAGVSPTDVSGYVPSGPTLFKALSAAATGTNSITAQPWFPTNGAVTVTANRTYLFRGLLSVARDNSGTVSFSFGGTATISSALYRGIGQSAAVNVNGTAQTSAWSNGAAAIICQPNGTAGWCEVQGLIRVTTGGTIIPQFTVSITPAVCTVASGTHFMLTEIGADTVTERGTWS